MASRTTTNVQPHTIVTPTRRSEYKILMSYPHFRDVSVRGYATEGLEEERERAMPQYRTSGGAIAYGERGEGPEDPVVLLHAFPLNRKMWAPQVEALGETRRVITPDYPGFGFSPRPPAQPDVRYYAELVGELLDKLRLDRVVLGGLSMGGL